MVAVPPPAAMLALQPLQDCNQFADMLLRFLSRSDPMRILSISVFLVVALDGRSAAEDITAVLNGTMFKIDADGNLWRQKGAFWVEVRRDGAYKNTQRISASQSDNLLIVLQNNWLHAVN